MPRRSLNKRYDVHVYMYYEDTFSFLGWYLHNQNRGKTRWMLVVGFDLLSHTEPPFIHRGTFIHNWSRLNVLPHEWST